MKNFLTEQVDKLLNGDAEKQIEAIKQETTKELDKTVSVLKKAGDLQIEVMEALNLSHWENQ